jgi:hypothetical protein
MRWVIAAACLTVAAIGVSLIIRAPDIARLPTGGEPVIYLGVAIAWGFTGVGASAWARRPENHTGALMVLVGALIGLTGLQF